MLQSNLKSELSLGSYGSRSEGMAGLQALSRLPTLILRHQTIQRELDLEIKTLCVQSICMMDGKRGFLYLLCERRRVSGSVGVGGGGVPMPMTGGK